MDACITCDEGSFTDTLGSATCTNCPKHATCADHIHVNVHPGHWRTSNSSLEIKACLYGKHACTGGPDGPESLCGTGYTGPKCGACAPDYFESNDGCMLCDGSLAETGLALFLTSFGVTVLVTIFGAFGAGKLHAKLMTTWRHHYNTYFDMAKFKIVWATLQIITAVDWSLDLRFPQPFAYFEV